MSTLLLLAAIACSIAMITWLRHNDPKRRRVAGLQAISLGASARRLVALAVLLPGLALAALGDSAAFLIWLGSCALWGWLVTQSRA